MIVKSVLALLSMIALALASMPAAASASAGAPIAFGKAACACCDQGLAPEPCVRCCLTQPTAARIPPPVAPLVAVIGDAAGHRLVGLAIAPATPPPRA